METDSLVYAELFLGSAPFLENSWKFLQFTGLGESLIASFSMPLLPILFLNIVIA